MMGFSASSPPVQAYGDSLRAIRQKTSVASTRPDTPARQTSGTEPRNPLRYAAKSLDTECISNAHLHASLGNDGIGDGGEISC